MLSPLRRVPHCRDRYALTTETVGNHVGRTAYDQLTNSRLGSDPPKMGILPKSLNNSNDAGCQSFRSFRFVPRHIGPNLLQSRNRERGPDDLYRHNFWPSCCLPHTHFGIGSSRLVPQESSHAFTSTLLM